MDEVLGSKDILFAFLGVFLSVLFSQGLYKRITTFFLELTFSVIPFGYQLEAPANEKFTKEQTARINHFQVERAKKMQRLQKSIACNTSVAMTLLVVACSAASFRVAGAEISHFASTWGLFLTILFVYGTYLIWSRIRDADFWGSLPAMSASRYNQYLTIAGATLIFYLLLLERGAFNIWVFYLFTIPYIYISLRLYRVPHINSTHRRALDFKEDEEFYLHDIGKETLIVLAVFGILSATHFIAYGQLKATTAVQYLNDHPIRSFLVLVSVPFVVFFGQFVRVVGPKALASLLFYVGKQRI